MDPGPTDAGAAAWKRLAAAGRCRSVACVGTQAAVAAYGLEPGWSSRGLRSEGRLGAGFFIAQSVQCLRENPIQFSDGRRFELVLVIARRNMPYMVHGVARAPRKQRRRLRHQLIDYSRLVLDGKGPDKFLQPNTVVRHHL